MDSAVVSRGEQYTPYEVTADASVHVASPLPPLTAWFELTMAGGLQVLMYQ